MGFNRTAVKTAVTDTGSTSHEALELPDQLELQLKSTHDQFYRQPRAVLCGSYRRDIPGLVRTYEKLTAAGMRVLSPTGLDFVAEIDGFVLNQDEVGTPPEMIERLHLNCIRAADLVWLHAPEGYVGISGALEIGFACSAGVPVFAEESPSDIALRSLVSITSLDEAIAQTSAGDKDAPGASLLPLQEYYSAIARERGYDHESAQDTMLLITEEVGELARAVRKSVGLKREGSWGDISVAEELADVQLYVLHLANVMGLDLANAVTDKERKNAQRFAASALADSA